MGRKKHMFSLLIILTVLTIIVVWFTGVFNKKEEESLVVKDLSGDPTVMSQAQISGVLRNGKQTTSFDWIGHDVKATTQFFRKKQTISLRPDALGAELGIGNKFYTVYGEQNFKIVEKDLNKKDGEQFRSAKVPSSLTYQWGKIKDDKLFVSPFTNPLEYGLTNIDDRVFFLVPNNGAYAGFNPIYELDFKQKDTDSNSRKIATIDLKGNSLLTQAQQPMNIEVLGLKAVGKQLAVVMTKNGKLVVQAYDSVSGKEMGTVEVNDLYLQSDLNDIMSAPRIEGKTIAQSYGYMAYGDEENGVLNLGFNIVTEGNSHRNVLFVSIDIKNKVLLSVLKATFSNPRESASDLIGIMQVAYIQNHLYVIRMEQEPKHNQAPGQGQAQEAEQDSVAKKQEGYRHLYVYVYNKLGLAYKGELVTSMNDDYVSWAEDTEGYHSGKYRFFEDWRITPVSK